MFKRYSIMKVRARLRETRKCGELFFLSLLDLEDLEAKEPMLFPVGNVN